MKKTDQPKDGVVIKGEGLTLKRVISEALAGNTQNLEGIIAGLTQERDALLKQTNIKLADLNARIDLLSRILTESKNGLG